VCYMQMLRKNINETDQSIEYEQIHHNIFKAETIVAMHNNVSSHWSHVNLF